MAKSQLERMEKRIRGSPSVTQEIAGCITTINNHLSGYTVTSYSPRIIFYISLTRPWVPVLDQLFALMCLQHDVNEIRTCTTQIAQSNFKQIQFIESCMTTGQLPATVSRGHAVLIDATGREHPLLLDQCRYLDVRSFNNRLIRL